MSETPNAISDGKDVNSTDAGGTVENVDSASSDKVDYNTYKRTLGQLKSQKMEMEALKKQLEDYKQAEAKAVEEKQKEEGRWKEIAERKEAKALELEQALKSQTQKFIDNQKIQAFLQEVGGLAKMDYLRHVDLEKIQVTEEGSIDSDSLKDAANHFRQNYPELLKQGVSKPNLPSVAPRNSTTRDVSKEAAEFLRSKMLNAKGSK